jgi:hypothetical protein
MKAPGFAEGWLLLQLRISNFSYAVMGFGGSGLMDASPERP